MSIAKFTHLLLFCLLLLVPCLICAAEVTNVQIHQDGNRAVFSYDLLGSESSDQIQLKLTIAGKQYIQDQLHLSGDIGNVSSGKGKQIIWDVLRDFPHGVGGDLQWELTGSGVKQQEVIKKTYTDPVTGMEFVWVKGGCYQMGQSEVEKRYLIKERGKKKYDYDNENPQHRVCVDDLYVGKHEVTVGQFRKFVNATGYRTDAEKNSGGNNGCYTTKDGRWGWRAGYDWESPGFSQQSSQPVVCVSWNDSQEYIDWLNRQTGKIYRLATEAEWEYAARGGTATMRFWGDDADQACTYANVADQSESPSGLIWNNEHECNDSYWFTAPVGHYRPNSFGLYDMLGNVWEWCNDWYGSDYYRTSPSNNPQGPSSGSYCVYRGGSWRNRPGSVRSAGRYGASPGLRSFYVGFRVVLP